MSCSKTLTGPLSRHSNTKQGTLILCPEEIIDKWKDLEVLTPP